MEIFKKLLNYYNHIRYMVVSLFSNDPYFTKIKSLECKIERLTQQTQVAPTLIIFSNELEVEKQNYNITIFQPTASNDSHPNLVNLRRERVQLCNMVGDYIGDYYVAINNKDDKMAQSIYNYIKTIDADNLDKKTSNKLNNFMSKIKK